MANNRRSAEAQKEIDAHVPVDQFTSSNIRSMARLGFQASMPYIISIAKGEAHESTPATSIRAHDVLGKWGMGDQPERILLEKRHWLTAVSELASKHFHDHRAYKTWCDEVLATLEQLQ